jgi:hypothetical protein
MYLIGVMIFSSFKDLPHRSIIILELNSRPQTRGNLVAPGRMCTPGMGVNLWGESSLYVNTVSGRYH